MTTGPTSPCLVGKGDRVKVKGHFRECTYEKDGETKTVRDFVVEDLKIERRKIGHQVEQELASAPRGRPSARAALFEPALASGACIPAQGQRLQEVPVPAGRTGTNGPELLLRERSRLSSAVLHAAIAAPIPFSTGIFVHSIEPEPLGDWLCAKSGTGGAGLHPLAQ